MFFWVCKAQQKANYIQFPGSLFDSYPVLLNYLIMIFFPALNLVKFYIVVWLGENIPIKVSVCISH